MLAAGEEGKWKEFLPSMGTEAHIPKLFKSSSKARCSLHKSRAWPVVKIRGHAQRQPLWHALHVPPRCGACV